MLVEVLIFVVCVDARERRIPDFWLLLPLRLAEKALTRRQLTGTAGVVTCCLPPW